MRRIKRDMRQADDMFPSGILPIVLSFWKTSIFPASISLRHIMLAQVLLTLKIGVKYVYICLLNFSYKGHVRILREGRRRSTCAIRLRAKFKVEENKYCCTYFLQLYILYVLVNTTFKRMKISSVHPPRTDQAHVCNSRPRRFHTLQ